VSQIISLKQKQPLDFDVKCEFCRINWSQSSLSGVQIKDSS